jgi:hypothetical protein
MRYISQYTTIACILINIAINYCLIMAFPIHSADSSYNSILFFLAISNNRYNDYSSSLYLFNTSQRRKRQNRNTNINNLLLHNNQNDNSRDSN